MKKYFRPTLTITVLTFLSQVVSFLVQVVIARRFGARSAVDAYWVGVTLPQYVISVCVQSLGFVFLPIFIDYFEKKNESEAWNVASGLLIWVTWILGFLVALGMIFARTFLHWTAPGLSPESLDTASRIARWTWPTILAVAWSNILANLYQAQQAFAWQAFVPFLGTLLNLALLMSLSRFYGITTVAIAATVSLFIQMALLLPILARKGRFRFKGSWDHPGVREILHLVSPLVLSSFLIRWTPVVDRYLASQLPEGVVSHLGYAFRICGVLSVLISVGLTTVIFPKLAASSARADIPELLRTLSLALRILWLLVAPVISIGAMLAIPVLTVLFQRGAFHASDSHTAGRLLQIYIFSLGASCLGNITGRVYYALKRTRLVAVIGSVESLAYVGYAYFLAHAFGAKGIAFSYVIYFNLSLLWQVLVLRYLLGPLGSLAMAKSMIRITLAAILAAALSWGIRAWASHVWVQVIAGGAGGLGLYAVALHVLGSPEWDIIKTALMESARFESLF